jgi:amino acid adenylation domain-containing protein
MKPDGSVYIQDRGQGRRHAGVNFRLVVATHAVTAIPRFSRCSTCSDGYPDPFDPSVRLSLACPRSFAFGWIRGEKLGDDAHSMRMSRVRPGHGVRHPLTEAQAEKWLGSRYSGGAALAFGEGFELAFDGGLDVEALSTAFAEVTERHEALSMRFEADGSAQVYEPPSGIGLRHVDFRNDREPHAAYAVFCAERTGEPFDPAAPPLVRAWLCRLGAAEWRLFLRAHHLVFDGWSLRIVLQDLAAHYNRRCAGAGKVPAVDSWIDYVRGERERRDGEPGRMSLAYWLDKYRDLPEPLRLPTDRARARRLSFAADTIEHAVPDGLWPQLRTVTRARGVTRFSLLLAGYLLLLHRLTGQCDLVCGIPFAGAARGGGARVVGDTDNTLPLRIRIVPEEPLPAFVRRVHDAVREAAMHQDVSLGRLVRALPLAREPGRLLLVESILTLNPAIERLRFDGVDCRMRVTPHQAAAWELAWQWRPLAGGMVLEVQYRSDLYLPATIRAWCDAYLGLLKQIARGDDIRVDDADAAAGEVFALADDRHRDHRDGDASLPDLLQEALSRHSGRRAARCGGYEIDYAALDRASRVAASGLRARGVVAGQLVGICMGRSIDMLVAVLAVLRSGAAYVPLDPSFPPERLRWMAEHARLGVIVADDVQRLPQGLARAAEVMHFADLANDDGRDVLLPKVGANDLAYVLYTSGSTGEPKGVRILHRNLVNFLRAMREAPGFDAGDVLCAATTLSFDIAALELYLPLLCGGCIVIADDREHRDPEALARLIERRGCTVLQTTPSLLALLLEVKRDHVLRSLKLLVGGEPFPPMLARALLPRCRELWNLYGPTETTVWSTVARVDAVEDAVPVGAPIAETRIYLLDARGRPTLPGALGEIWIGGAGVADGYLHRPDLTAERFVGDTFAADGSRMYRTGDLGRIRDGNLYFHGRVDEQIKLRGYRIEPAEIEAAAAGEAGVIECVAVARDAGNGDQVLVLYAGSDAAPDALAARLRRRCARLLPAYMWPQHVVVLKTLPKTPNGKIDRRALPAPDPAQSGLAQSDRAAADAATPSDDPRDPLQVELRDAWRRLLRRPDVGVHDNFFELGGYSLLAVRLFAELHERHGVDLPLSTLIERPTVAGLAEALREAMRERDARPSRPGALLRSANDDAEAQSSIAPDNTLVELRAGGGLPPLFLAHAVGGNVLNYLPIASGAAPGRAVYGLQSPGLDGVEAPLATIEAMAARYARAIRGCQPHGPYLLAGGSMGGVLALEIARCLREDGDEIAFLGMFDTWRPGATGWAGESPWRPHRWWSLYRGLDAGQRAALWRRIGFRLWRLPTLRLRESLGRGTTQELRRHRVESSNQNALAAYRPRPYAGRIVLFRAMQAGGGDATLGWSGFADGVDVIELGGRHDTILEQPELPLRVRECIAALRPDFDRATMNPEDHPDAHLSPGIDALRAAATP